MATIFLDTISGMNNENLESSGTFTLPLTIANNTNRILIARIGFVSELNAGVYPDTVTYAGSGLTEYVRQVWNRPGSNPDQNYIGIWYLLNPPTGTNTFSVNINPNGSIACIVGSYYGVNQSTPFRGSAVASGIGDGSLTISSAVNDLVIDGLGVFYQANPSTATVTGAGQVKEKIQQEITIINYDDHVHASNTPGAASVTIGWALDVGNTQEWVYAAVSLIPAAAVNVTTSGLISGKANLASASSQIGRPSADITVGNWLSSSSQALYQTISGLNTSDPKYIYSPNVTGNYSEVMLGGLSTPISVSGHVISFRAKGDNSSATLKVSLYQGVSLIQEETFSSLSSTFTKLSFLITTANVANISNYGDLRLRFTAGP
jgi:hypothetical protein